MNYNDSRKRKYEYMVEVYPILNDLPTQLNARAKEGWRVSSVCYVNSLSSFFNHTEYAVIYEKEYNDGLD